MLLAGLKNQRPLFNSRSVHYEMPAYPNWYRERFERPSVYRSEFESRCGYKHMYVYCRHKMLLYAN